MDPRVGVVLPVNNPAIFEPERDLLLGVLSRVRAVADVAADNNREVAANGARQRLLRVGGAEHHAASLDRLLLGVGLGLGLGLGLVLGL